MKPVPVFGGIMALGLVLGALGFVLRGSGFAILLLILGAFLIMTGATGLKRFVEYENQEKAKRHEEEMKRPRDPRLPARDGETVVDVEEKEEPEDEEN